MLPKTGSRLPGAGRRVTECDYVAAISTALRDELGTTGAASKTIMRWTGASERTARNWMTGVAAPSAPHLMSLMRESDGVLAVVMTMSDRPELVLAADLHAIEVALAKASGAFKILERQRTTRSK